jgi:F-type H+-transporting ATPase subunit epsilon
MATFHFDLVAPEKMLFSGEVEQVDVPGTEGYFGVLAGHAPLVSTLRPGILTVFAAGSRQDIVVRGGFAEVNPEGLTVLADWAVAPEDLDRARLAADIKDLEEDAADAPDPALRDKLAQKVDQLRAVQTALE